jgi:cobalt-zinc-cadmium efflux system membrane fusion protein
MKQFVPWFLLMAISVAMSREAHAHGGEDHSAPVAAATATPGASSRTTFGQTGQFEVLVKLASRSGDAADLRVFVADWATNAPVPGATVELEIQSSPVVQVSAEAAGGPGLYHAIAQVPEGEFSLVATITAGERVDLIDIAPLDFSTFAPVAAIPDRHREIPWRWILLAIGAVAAFAVGLTLVRMRGARRVAPTALLLLTLSAPLVARGHGGEDHGAPAPAPIGSSSPGGTYMAKESQFLLGVLTRAVSEREVSARIETIGRVVPRIDGHAQIAAAVSGRVLAPKSGVLPFLGDHVRKGQVLLVLEQTPGAAESGDLRARGLEARSGVAQARARRDQASRELERRRALVGVVAQKDIEEAALELELTERALELAERQVALFAGDDLRRVTVTAPIDGVIAEAQVSLGEQVAADQQLYTILEPSTLWVEANVFEADIRSVREAGIADVRLEGYATAFPAKLFRLGQLVDPTTRTVKAIFAVDNAEGAFRPGMFAEIGISAGAPRRSLVVPDSAVIEEGARRFVFVHVAPEDFVRREVVLGERDGEDWAASAGVAAGERVVTQGTYQLRTVR